MTIRTAIGLTLVVFIFYALAASHFTDARLSKVYRLRKLVEEDKLYSGNQTTALDNVLPGCFLIQLSPPDKDASSLSAASTANRARAIVRNIRKKLSNVQIKQHYDAFEAFSLKTNNTNDTSTLLKLLEEENEVMSVYPVILIPPPDAASIPRILPSLLSGDYAVNSSAAGIINATLASLGLPRFTGADIRVGIIDTGVDVNHPALQGPLGSRVVARMGFVSDNFTPGAVPEPTSNVNDCMGHGTHVAGIIAGSYNSSNFRYHGIAPGVTLGVYKVFGCNSSTTSDIILAALDQAVKDGMQIINLSLGIPGAWGGAVADTVEKLSASGILVVASIGNEGESGLFMPSSIANAPSVIAVGSTDSAAVPTALRVKLTTAGDDITLFPRVLSGSVNTLLGAGLQPFSAAASDFCTATASLDVAGRVALVTAAGCDAAVKATNVANAGGIGVILYGDEVALGDLLRLPYSWPAPSYAVPVLAVTLDTNSTRALFPISFRAPPSPRPPSPRPPSPPPPRPPSPSPPSLSSPPSITRNTAISGGMTMPPDALSLSPSSPANGASNGQAPGSANPSLVRLSPSPSPSRLAPPSQPVPGTPAHSSAPVVGTIGGGRRRGRQLSQVASPQFIISEIVGSRVSPTSTWGPSPDLRMKPSVVAPGGGILGLQSSTVPGQACTGCFAYRSGTSHAAPFVVGALALMMEAVKSRIKPWTAPQIARALITTANPVLDLNGSLTSGASILRIGGGSVNIGSLLTTRIDVNPARIEIGSSLTFGNSYTTWLDIAMVGPAMSAGLPLQLSHQPASSIVARNLLVVNRTATGPMNNRTSLTYEPVYSPMTATVTFGSSRLNNISSMTVPVAGNMKLKVTITLPPLPAGRTSPGIFYSGYIVLRPTNNSDPSSPPQPTLSIPYSGFSNPLSGLPVLVMAGISTNNGSWLWDDNDSFQDGWYYNEMRAPPPSPPPVAEYWTSSDYYASDNYDHGVPPTEYSPQPSPPLSGNVSPALMFTSSPRFPSIALFLQRQAVIREIELWRAQGFVGMGTRRGTIRIPGGIFPRTSNDGPLVITWDGSLLEMQPQIRVSSPTPGKYFFVVRLSRGSAYSDGPESTSNVDVWMSPVFDLALTW